MIEKERRQLALNFESFQPIFLTKTYYKRKGWLPKLRWVPKIWIISGWLWSCLQSSNTVNPSPPSSQFPSTQNTQSLLPFDNLRSSILLYKKFKPLIHDFPLSVTQFSLASSLKTAAVIIKKYKNDKWNHLSHGVHTHTPYLHRFHACMMISNSVYFQ